MSTIDINAIAAVLKRDYAMGKIQQLGDPISESYAKLKKSTDFVGEAHSFTVGTALPPGFGDFSNALANQGVQEYDRFTIRPTRMYAIGTVSTEAVRATNGDKGAQIKIFKDTVDKHIRLATRMMAIYAQGNGGGALGQISSGSTVSSATITLSTPSQVYNFQKGMWVSLASDDGSSATPAGLRTGKARITGMDVDAGTLTVQGTWSGNISGASTSDYIFAAGYYGSVCAFYGYDAWIPSSAPSASDAFNGLNRSTDPTRLAGIRVTSQGTYEDTLITAAHRIFMEGAPAGDQIVVVHPLDFAAIEKSQTSKVLIMKPESKETNVGFQKLAIMGPMGPIPLVADVYRKLGTAKMLSLSTWEVKSRGAAPGPIDDLGPYIMPDPTQDGWQIRIGAYAQMKCVAPAWNADIAF